MQLLHCHSPNDLEQSCRGAVLCPDRRPDELPPYGDAVWRSCFRLVQDARTVPGELTDPAPHTILRALCPFSTLCDPHSRLKLADHQWMPSTRARPERIGIRVSATAS